MKSLNIYKSIAAGNLFLLKLVKIDKQILFRTCCLLNSPETIKIFPKIKKEDQNWYYGMIGFTAATVLASDYHVYGKKYFLNGLARANLDLVFPLVKDIMIDMNDEAIDTLILYTAEYDNEDFFDYLVSLRKAVNPAHCIIKNTVSYKYYKKMIDFGTSPDVLMQMIIHNCALLQLNPQSYLAVAEKLNLRDKAGLRILSQQFGFGDFVGVLAM